MAPVDGDGLLVFRARGELRDPSVFRRTSVVLALPVIALTALGRGATVLVERDRPPAE